MRHIVRLRRAVSGGLIGVGLLIAMTAAKIPPPPGRALHSNTALRVCADPNNLPFSNQKREGFENRLAEMIARDLNTRTEYVWWPQRRGFVRMTLLAGQCDVIIGVPSAFEMGRTTHPYYRSSYGFLSRRTVTPAIRNFDDPRLRTLHVGVQMIGDDFSNSPPAHALSARGIVRNITGFSVLGDYSQPNPPAGIVDAVAGGSIDVAVVWGPLAGYFAARRQEPLTWTPVDPEIDPPFLPFAFDISMAVRRDDAALWARLDEFIRIRRAAIDRILAEYHVPRTKVAGGLR